MKQPSTGRLLNLSTQKRRLPNGHVSVLEIIEHPGAVLIIPILSDERFVLIRQYRPVMQQYLYEFPAGTLNPKEKPLRCAYRELTEETGYQAKTMKKLGKIFPVPGYSTEVITIYQADQLTLLTKSDLKEQGIHKDPDELLTVRLCSKTEIKNLFKNGRIHDAKTICALAFSGIL